MKLNTISQPSERRVTTKMKTLEAGRYTTHRLMKVNRDEIKHDITAVREESTTNMKTLEAGRYTTQTYEGKQ